ncbi:expressed unknown protein [Ectocarpus siliculosus]|uniref:Uncharacterized protein n=1 Tax=Ectocarpus siliculosus TaxID=2880 RepID=D7FSW4_ECTSI|nr:expressed unknown protein [Ectocarpus siliculosus]|eukprot:CBJ31255.1 expressed unknown protein [Ectocarpus siliculosus]
MGTPKKLLELIEDRDRALHLCLQYRCKLRNTEGSLRAEERLASELKGQLREANAAGEATRKLFDQVMDKVRADEGRKIRQAASSREDDKSNARYAEDARKGRLQLTRARKDLRELWLERDELAKLAGQAIQGEQAGSKRIKKLELVVSSLREQVAALALSEHRAAEEAARAEARAASAEAAEQDLRAAVEGIKTDFEALVHELRIREKQIRQMEAKNATLAVKSLPTSPTPRGHTRSRSPAETGNAEGDNQRVSPRTRRMTPESKGCVRVKELRKSRNSRVDPSPARAKEATSLNTQALAHPQKRGKRGEEAGIPPGKNGRRSNAPPAAAVPSVVYPARKQLAPRKSEIPGRVMAMSYPRGVNRVTFMPSNTHVTTPPARVPASVPARETVRPVGPILEEGNCCMEEVEEEVEEEEDGGGEVCSAPTEVAGTVTDDGRRPEAQLDQSGEEKSGAPETSPPSPGQDCAVPPQSPSPRHCRQPACTFSETAAPPASDPRPTVGMSNTTEVALADLGGAAPEDGVVGLGSAGGTERLTTDAETREGADNASAEGVPPPPLAQIASTGRFSGDDDEPGEEKSTPHGGKIEEAKSEAGHGIEATPEQPGLEEGRRDPDAAAFRPRLVEGVPVLKYGGRGKPKAKMLWVTPDLSEIFYTQAGRTKNSKKSSHMPLAGLCASKGRGDHPEPARSTTDDRCFALVQAADSLGHDNPHHKDKDGGGSESNGAGEDADEGGGGGGGSPAPGRRKWGIGGTLPANLVHGRRWRGGPGSAATTTGPTERLGASATSASGSAATAAAVGTGAGAAPQQHPAGATRERMVLETTNAEECTALVDEINELVRRAGLQRGGGGSSARGRDLFDEWVRSAVGRDAQAVDPGANGEAAEGAQEGRGSAGGDAPVALLAG